jgi:hypothetical protein
MTTVGGAYIYKQAVLKGYRHNGVITMTTVDLHAGGSERVYIYYIVNDVITMTTVDLHTGGSERVYTI